MSADISIGNGLLINLAYWLALYIIFKISNSQNKYLKGLFLVLGVMTLMYSYYLYTILIPEIELDIYLTWIISGIGILTGLYFMFKGTYALLKG